MNRPDIVRAIMANISSILEGARAL